MYPTPELPIGLRKGTRSCTTKHLIADVDFFSHLSSTYSAFASYPLLVPMTYHEALLDPG